MADNIETNPGTGGAVVPEVVPTRAGGGGGKAFRVTHDRQASPYKDARDTAAELLSALTIEPSKEAEPAPIAAEKIKPIESANRRDATPEILADIQASNAAQSAMAQAMRGVEAQLRAALIAQDMDEDEAIALVLILAEA